MKLTFRPAVPEDIDALCALVRAATEHLDEQGIYQWDEAYPTRDILLADIAAGEMTVGVSDGEIAVLFVLNRTGEEDYANGSWQYPDEPWFVGHRLCVHPKFQNRGVGKRTMEQIEGEVLRRGGRVLRLDTFSKNPWTLRLYRGRGYETVGYVHWEKGTFHLMEKKLEEL